jgi:type IV pilus assembly protein PilW
MRQINTTQRLRGFSLVELMVAITIGFILSAGAIQIFMGSKTTYRVTEGLSRAQENGRFAMEFLTNRVRMAGYMGCGNIANLAPNILVTTPPANLAFTANDAMSGQDNVATGDTIGGQTLVAGSDTILVRGASPLSTPLSAVMASATADITIAANPAGFDAGDYLFVTDCENADIFQATGVTATSIGHTTASNSSNSLSSAYGIDALILVFDSTQFFVADTGRTNRAGDMISALYAQTVTGGIDELVEGVEDMQVLYGLDTNQDGSVDQYLSAGSIGANAWGNVMTVHVDLLVNTVEDVNPQAQTYTYMGTATTPADRKLRRTFSTTINIRNHTS